MGKKISMKDKEAALKKIRDDKKALIKRERELQEDIEKGFKKNNTTRLAFMRAKNDIPDTKKAATQSMRILNKCYYEMDWPSIDKLIIETEKSIKKYLEGLKKVSNTYQKLSKAMDENGEEESEEEESEEEEHEEE